MRGVTCEAAAGFQSWGGDLMNRPPSSFSMLLSRHTRRREFIAGLGGAAAWPVVARAHQPMPVIGLLDVTPPGSNAEPLRAFHQGLKETGYVEGENMGISYRFAE